MKKNPNVYEISPNITKPVSHLQIKATFVLKCFCLFKCLDYLIGRYVGHIGFYIIIIIIIIIITTTKFKSKSHPRESIPIRETVRCTIAVALKTGVLITFRGDDKTHQGLGTKTTHIMGCELKTSPLDGF